MFRQKHLTPKRCWKMETKKLDTLVQLVVRERFSVRQAAEAIGVSHTTAYRMLENVRFAVG